VTRKPTPLLLVAFLLVAILYARFLWQHGPGLLEGRINDLPSFYYAAQMAFVEHVSPYDAQRLDAHSERRVHPFLYPPPSLLVFYPLSLTSFDAAALTVLVANHLLLLLSLYLLLFRLLGLGNRPLWLAGASIYTLCFFPISVVFDHGQVSLALLPLLSGFWICSRNRRDTGAALCLAAAILLKSYPALLLGVLVLCGRSAIALRCVVFLAATSALAGGVLPAEAWNDWFAEVLPSGGYGGEPGGVLSPASVWNQSLNGISQRLFTSRPWSLRLMDEPQLAVGVAYAACGCLMGLSFGALLRREDRTSTKGLDYGIAVSLPLIYLVAPLSWEHHLVVVLPTLFMLGARQSGPPGTRSIILALVALVLAP
jgi:hypothetical protein